MLFLTEETARPVEYRIVSTVHRGKIRLTLGMGSLVVRDSTAKNCDCIQMHL